MANEGYGSDGQPLSDDDIVALLRVEKAQASSYQNSTLSQNRTTALKYYMGEPYGDEQEERSKVVTTEVRDTIEAVLPQLVKLFMSSDRVVRFEAGTVEEEEAADQATDYINHVIQHDNDGFMLLYTFFKDALLQKNGITKQYWDEVLKTTEETYTGLLQDELYALLQDEEIEPIELSQSDSVTMPGQEQQQPQPQPGQPPAPPQPSPLFDVKVKRTQKRGRARAVPVPPEEFLISLKAPSIQKARFVGHRSLKSISELIEMGIPKDKVWDMSGDAAEGDLNAERNTRFLQDGSSMPDSDAVQKAMRQVWVTECFYSVDTDGDGIAEKWRFLIAGNNDQLLQKERWDDDWPFASATPIPMPHKFYGMSLFDIVQDIQRIKSTITRQFLDNMYHMNNNRTIVQEDLVNLDDLLTNRPGGIVRTKANPSMVAMPLQPQPLGAIVVPALEYLDSVNEKRTGVTAYNQGLDANSLNKTATGINIINNAAQERMLLIARIFAETGVKEIFGQLLKLIVRHQDKPRTIKLRGKWVTMDPSKWNSDMAVSVDVALGTSNQQQQLMILNQLLMIQKEAIMTGAPVVSWPKIYNTLTKMVEAAGLRSVESYFDDPAKVPPQPQQPNPEEIKAQAAQQLQSEKLQHDKEIEAFKAEQAAKQSVLQIGLKKMDINSRERIARQNMTTDLLQMLGQGGGSAGGQADGSAGGKRPSRITIRRNPVTREVEEIIPVYEKVEQQLGGDSGEFDGFSMS